MQRVPALPPRGLHIARRTSHDGRTLAQGVECRRGARGNAVRVDGHTLPLSLPGVVRHAARTTAERPIVIEHARAAETPPQLTWIDSEGRVGTLLNPHGLGLTGPTFLADGRFLYVAELPEALAELRIGCFEPGGRVVSTRVGRAGRFGGAPVSPVVGAGGSGALVFDATDEGWVPLWVDLADGSAQPLAEAGGRPQAATVAQHAACAAWIDEREQLFVGGPARATRHLGAARGDVLALDPDGDRVAWLERDRLLLRGVEPDAPTERYAIGPDAVGLRFDTPTA